MRKELLLFIIATVLMGAGEATTTPSKSPQGGDFFTPLSRKRNSSLPPWGSRRGVEAAPFSVTPLFHQDDRETLGLEYAPGAETVTVFCAEDSTDHYANGAVMAAFKGALYCMWQSSKTDEDSPDTWVAYSRSDDGGRTWSKPERLSPVIEGGFCTSGGWVMADDTLVAYINVWDCTVTPKTGYVLYRMTTDDKEWSEARDVTWADGTRMDGIMEQDPHRLPHSTRLIGAVHLMPGLRLIPIYTDDTTGRGGWRTPASPFPSVIGREATLALQERRGERREETMPWKVGTPSPFGEGWGEASFIEPSFFLQEDGTIVMTIRDQKSSHRIMAATSSDSGVTWSDITTTNMPDSRAKQCAGNLPDGTAFIVNNPINEKKPRVPLVLTLSRDGRTFTEAYLLRSGKGDDCPKQRYPGRYKTLGYSYPKAMVHDGYLYVSYVTNKEMVQYTRAKMKNEECKGVIAGSNNRE